MKFGIDIGHNCKPDTGTLGLPGGLTEDQLTMAVGTKLIQKLKDAGHTVVECKPSSASSVPESLQKRTNKANQEQVNLFVSIHFNSFDAKVRGSEVFALSNAAKAIATSVLKEIVQLGFPSRGVKSANYYVLKNTNMPAILVECCFCDSAKDMAIFDAEEMAEAIKVGLIGQSAETTKKYVLEITAKTVLKPSSEQAKDLPPGSCIDITPGKYPILDFSSEEKHYCVEWPDSSKGNRKQHFVFAEYCKVTAV
jgi:N-acetylmuramoyl-L-alanine amidase